MATAPHSPYAAERLLALSMVLLLAMKRFVLRLFLPIAVMLFVGVRLAYGQPPSGSILGTVRDESGGVMPGVSVSARSLETGAMRTVSSDTSGTYQIVSLPA